MEHSDNPNIPVESTERRRFGLLRRAGTRSLHGAEVKIYPLSAEIDEEAEALFGLESEITEYVSLWTTHQEFIKSAYNDDELKFNTGELLHTHADSLIDAPKDKRQSIHRLANDGYERFVGVYILAGRIETHNILAASVSSIKSSVTSVLNHSKETRAVIGKVNGLISDINMPIPGNRLTEVARRFNEIRSTAGKTYKPISKLEYEIACKVADQFDNNPQAARKFLDTFQEYSSSEVRTEQAMARIFANRHLALGNESELSYAMQVLEQNSADGALAYNYIEDKIASQDGDNIWAFMARQSNTTSDQFIHKTAAAFDTWPTDLKNEYQRMVVEQIAQYKMMVKSCVDKAKYRPWMSPDRDSLEAETDRLFLTLYNKYIDPKLNRKQIQTGRAAKPKAAIAPHHLLPTFEVSTEPERPLQLHLAQYVAGEGFITKSLDSSEQLIALMLGKDSRDKEYHQEISQVLEALRKDPFSAGIASLRSVGKSKINGAEYKWLRANIAQMQLPNISKRTKQSRVIFAVSRDANDLQVFTIANNHQDYEVKIKQLVSITQ